jgi:DNA-binding SARP family transcriptional activator/TolB-like protein/Tfp pilus assembly protein PilF
LIRFRTLGGLELRNVELEELRSILTQPKRATLLAYLALSDSSGFRRRDTIVSLFWPESDDAHARAALRQAVRFLRRSLGEGVIVSRGEEELGVAADQLWIDAVAFEHASANGRNEEALDLYRGPFLEGLHVSDASPELERWIDGKRAEYSRRAVASGWALAETHRASGDLHRASTFARRAFEIAPDDEAGLRRLILLLDDIGDRSSALEIYETFARRLKNDIDADPSPETRATVEKIRTRTSQPHSLAAVESTQQRVYTPRSDSSPLVSSSIAAEMPSRLKRITSRALGAALIVTVAAAFIAAQRGDFFKRRTSIAVLPAEDLTGDRSGPYIAEALTDQLITDLAQGGVTEVINRRTMMTYAGSRKTPREIASELKAGAVVSSTVQYAGDTVRMAAQLILANDDKAIWAQSYEGSRSDLLRMQREAARSVIQQLRSAMKASDAAGLPYARRQDPRALDLYIQGRYWWNKRGPGLLKSIGLFTEALDVDPTFALAYSGMADAYVQLGYASALAPGDAFPKARAAAQRALQLDSTLAEPHATLAFVHMYYYWNWAASEAEFKRALALNPSYATGHEWYGLFLTAMGRFEEGRAQEHRAQELDPLSTAIAGTAAWVLYYAGRSAEAYSELQIVLRTDSAYPLGHLYLGRVDETLGRYDSALVQYDATGPLRSWIPTIAAKGFVFGKVGRLNEANDVLVQLDSLAHRQYVTAYGIALVHAGLGRKDSAFVWLDRGVKERTHWLVWLNRDPRWDSIRADVRFASLVRQVGLPP